MMNELEELIKEHKTRCVMKKYNSYGVINNVFRVLRSIVDNKHSQKYFTDAELGMYEETRQPLHIKERRYVISRAVKAGWLKEIVLPNSIRRNRKFEGDIQSILQDPKISTKISKMRGLSYYCITDSGKRVYKNIKEILDVMSE